MPRRRLFWHLYLLYLAITLTAFLAANYYSARALRQFYLRYTADDLASRAVLAAELLREKIPGADQATLETFCRELGAQAATRLTIIGTNGSVLADSISDAASMDNHAHRPEVAEALAGRVGRSQRYSDTAGELFMYVAVPVIESGHVASVARASISMVGLNDTLAQLQRRMAIATLVIGGLVFLIVLALLQRVSSPLEEVKRGAQRFAAGDLSFRIPGHDSEEIGSLAETLNVMASQLNERISTIINQRNEMQAVLSSMVEGVVAIDNDERILQANRAALEFIGARDVSPVGRPLTEVARNPVLQRLVESAVQSGRAEASETTLFSDRERVLNVRTSQLRDSSGRGIGALIVLHDLTEVRRLERIRSDFVANVSHELKTPLTSIKGFVETLQDGAVRNPEEARRFLDIIGHHVDRLQAILEDLLSLSRIEQEAERDEIELKDGSIADALTSAIQLCRAHAEARHISIALDCPASARAQINAPLLEQAAVNLIENAIKYSEPGKSLRIEVRQADREWLIRFIDQGFGIEEMHLPRIFERFYRVDKARNRKEGGTGLGLAIVKHIVTAHRGRVDVTSALGKGSVFVIHLPSP